MEPRKELVEAVASQETGGESDPDSAVSSKGAEGRFQIKPSTAQAYGYDPKRLHEKDYNRKAATGILGKLLDKHKGDEHKALSDYYGHGKAGKGQPTTDQYASQVLKRAGGSSTGGNAQKGGVDVFGRPVSGETMSAQSGTGITSLSDTGEEDLRKKLAALDTQEADAKAWSLKNLHWFLSEAAHGALGDPEGAHQLAKNLFESSPVSYLTKTGPVSKEEFAQHGMAGKLTSTLGPEFQREHPEATRLLGAGESAAEWAGWGEAVGLAEGAIGAVSPLSKYVPDLLAHVVHAASAGSAIGVAMAAATAKVQGQPITSHDIKQNFALGAILGGLSGAYHGDAMAAINEKYPLLKESAGPSGMQGLRDVQRLASSFGREEHISEGDAMKNIAALLTGKGEASWAAKVRLMAAAEPERFRSETMKALLKAATDDLTKEHIKVPSHEELAEGLGLQPQPMGRSTRGLATGRTPGMPEMKGPASAIPKGFNEALEAARAEPTFGEKMKRLRALRAEAKTPEEVAVANEVIGTNEARPHLDTLMKELATRTAADKELGRFSPAAVRASRALGDMAMDGRLLPEHVDSPHEASAVAAQVFRRAGENEKGGYDYTRHKEAGKEWQRRVRALGGTGEEDIPAKIDTASPTDLGKLREAIDHDKPAPTDSKAPGGTRRITKEAQEKRKGKIC
jgi:transglycosylase-like protein with SLT domain